MDTAAYIGIPFEWRGRDHHGVDCYGLVCMAYEAEGIQLPDYAYMDAPELSRLFAAGLREPCWHEVTVPKALDVVVFRINGHPLHCGVMVDRHDFLHAREGINSCVERLDAPAWRNRVWGFYRHA